jgi:hypothetical protein
MFRLNLFLFLVVLMLGLLLFIVKADDNLVLAYVKAKTDDTITIHYVDDRIKGIPILGVHLAEELADKHCPLGQYDILHSVSTEPLTMFAREYLWTWQVRTYQCFKEGEL